MLFCCRKNRGVSIPDVRLGVGQVILEQKQEVEEAEKVRPDVDCLVVNVKNAEKIILFSTQFFVVNGVIKKSKNFSSKPLKFQPC